MLNRINLFISLLLLSNIAIAQIIESSALALNSNWIAVDAENARFGPSSWSVSTEEILQNSDIYNSTTNKGTHLYYKLAFDLNDATMQWDQLSDDNDSIGFLFRYTDEMNYYRFYSNHQRNFRRLEKSVNGVFTLIAEDSIAYTPGVSETVRIEVVGDNIQIFVDDSQVFDVTDSTHTEGTFAFSSYGNRGSHFSNLTVESIQETTPALSLNSNWIAVDAENARFGPSSWSVSTEEILQNSDIYNSTTNKGTHLYYKLAFDLNDATMQWDQLSDDNDSIGFLFRYTDEMNYYRFYSNSQRNFRRLEKSVNGVFTLIAEDSIAYTPSVSETVRIEVVGDNIQIFVDDSQVFDVTDSTHTKGTFAFSSYGNRGSHFSNLTVESIPPVNNENLLSHWPLNESNGLEASDSTGNNPGTLVNSPIWQPTQGQFGGALEFDGIDDRVDLGNLDISGSQMSIAFWFKADDLDIADARLISKATGLDFTEHFWMVSTQSNSRLRFRLKTNGQTTTLISPSLTLPVDQWHHVTASYDGNNMMLYHNGELIADITKTGEIDTNSNIPVALGNQPVNAGSKPFDGLMDDVRIYTAALTINEIQEIIEDGAINPPTTSNIAPIANAGSDQTITVNNIDDVVPVTLNSAASFDSDGTINSVKWHNENGQQLSTNVMLITTLPVGIHTFTLTVTDNEGANASDSVVVIINNESVTTNDETAPVVSITSPSTDEIITGVVTISADATDNNDVTAVAFFLDGNQLDATDTTAPYAISWNTLDETNGTYTLVAKAYDAAGNVGTSSAVQGVIENVIGDSNAINIQITPNRTNCVAPCSILFNASSTTATITSKPFHELNYRWNFADVDSGNWAWSGKSKNIATGSVSTHVFESAGEHNVTLVVRDNNGNVATQQTAITIIDPDSFYTEENTYCFSRSDDFSGCPTALASQHITNNDIQIVESYVGSGRRLLLHRGDSWSTNSSVRLAGTGPSVLGAFGECASPDDRGICTNAPNISITSSSSNGINSSFSSPMLDWRVMDIELTGPSGSDDSGFEARNDNQHILLLRMNIHDFHGLVKVDDSGNFDNGNITVADSSLRNSVGGNGANGIWFSGNNMSIIGTEVSDSTKSEHVVRLPYMNVGVISNNELSDQASTKLVLKLHSQEWENTGRYSEKIVISDNKFKSSDLSSVVWTIAIEPQSCTGTRDERIRDVIVERNLFQSGVNSQSEVIIGARDITLRNNLFNMRQGQFQRGVLIRQCNQEPPPKDIDVVNNSFYSAYDGEFRAISVNSNSSNISVINNLAYAPNSNNPQLFSGPTFAQSNLLETNNPFMEIQPVNAEDFRLQTNSSAINSGTDFPSVLDDFELNYRSIISSTTDIGAFEQ